MGTSSKNLEVCVSATPAPACYSHTMPVGGRGGTYGSIPFSKASIDTVTEEDLNGMRLKHNTDKKPFTHTFLRLSQGRSHKPPGSHLSQRMVPPSSTCFPLEPHGLSSLSGSWKF